MHCSHHFISTVTTPAELDVTPSTHPMSLPHAIVALLCRQFVIYVHTRWHRCLLVTYRRQNEESFTLQL